MTEIACKDLVEVVTDYLEDALPPPERAAFEDHLAGCDFCIEYLDQMRTLASGSLRALATDALAPEQRDALLDAFRGGGSGH